MSTHDHYPDQPIWQTGELEPSNVQYLLEKLSDLPFLTPAFRRLGDGLMVGSSRTVYNLPINQFPNNERDAMLCAAREASEAICDERLGGLEMRIDELPEQFEAEALPDGIKASIAKRPIGYMRMERTEAGLKASVGALDPKTQTHYSVPLN